MTIKEIKRPRSKSHSAIIAKLQAALTESRDNQYLGVGFVLIGKGTNPDVIDFFLVPDTLISVATSAVRDLEKEIEASIYDTD